MADQTTDFTGIDENRLIMALHRAHGFVRETISPESSRQHHAQCPYCAHNLQLLKATQPQHHSSFQRRVMQIAAELTD